MRPRISNRYRQTHPTLGASPSNSTYGYFAVPVGSVTLHVISSGKAEKPGDWEHVSVSLPDRCPTWDEMCYIKDMFWNELETVVQFHPSSSKYVNTHPYCLHLWKKDGVHELPPQWMV